MSAAAIALALVSAILQPTWNALLRGGADRLWTITVMTAVPAVLSLPIALALPHPLSASWPYLLVSASLQVGYSVFLAAAYQHGGLGQVFPVVRGSVPLLVTMGGLVFAHQHPSALAWVGILLVAGGILSLALGRHRTTFKSLLLAVGAGMFVAGYVTVDGLGVRLAGGARSYALWSFLLDGLAMPFAFVAMRGRLRIDVRSAETWKANAAGLISLVSYIAFVSALSLGPIGPLSALRETSVVFAALIGWLFLGEQLTVHRLVSCAIVALGAFCLGHAAH